MIKQLARLSELQQSDFSRCMERINRFAHEGGLVKYTTYSRIWEYPWVCSQLKALNGKGLWTLDIGSEKSPFPWFLAQQGFNVVVSDVTAGYWRLWQMANQQLNANVRRRVLDAQDVRLRTASMDIYLSVSVIEHVPDKAKVIEEAARVLRPGGLMVMTFDICEPDMEMTFPQWNGRALTMAEFDGLFRNSPWFEPGLSELPWNTSDIPEFLSWHRSTAPHHNYVTGGALVRRNDRTWEEPAWKDHLRTVRGRSRTISSVAVQYLLHGPRAVRRRVARLKRVIRQMLHRLTMPPLTSLPNAPDLFHVYHYLQRHPDLERAPGGWLYMGEFYPDYLTVGGAGHAIFRDALKYCQGEGIDMGAGLWPLPGAIPVDVSRGPGVGRTISEFKDGSLDYVFSSHCLEHIENWQEAFREWVKKLKPGGMVFLYLPHPDCAIWHPGSPFVHNGHKWIPTPEIIKRTFQELGCEIEQFDDGPDPMYSFYVCGRR